VRLSARAFALLSCSEAPGDVIPWLVPWRRLRPASRPGPPLWRRARRRHRKLNQVTKVVLESALEGEMDAHLGYVKHDPAGRDGGNSRNGRRPKTVVTDVGPVEVSMPRDRDSSFEPVIQVCGGGGIRV
jgi:hypothetical protein